MDTWVNYVIGAGACNATGDDDKVAVVAEGGSEVA